MKFKNLFNKTCMFTLCTFSLPFLVHGSAFGLPNSQKNERERKTEHAEVNLFIDKVVRKNQNSVSSTTKKNPFKKKRFSQKQQKDTPFFVYF